MVKYESIKPGITATTKIRSSDPGTISELYPDENRIRVEFASNVAGVAPGQSAVFYEQDDVIGGGIIHAPVSS